MGAVSQATDELKAIFRRHRDKRAAHQRAVPLLGELAQDSRLITEALEQHLRKPRVLNSLHYPVVALELSTNPDFVLVLNCWIPLPSGRSDISTKAIHHHGSMLLTTTTAFGPGYEHWMFTLPEEIGGNLFKMRLLDVAPHPLHHVSFVDSWICHLPLFPPALTITMALWSSEKPTDWKDHVKRIPLLKKNEATLRRLAKRVGLARSLDIKIPDNFDFYPVENGFVRMGERLEFARGPNDDYLYSLFHVLQKTGNDRLAPVVRDLLRAGTPLDRRTTVEMLLEDLERGRPIEGRLSDGHTDVPYATFPKTDIQRALNALKAKE